MKLILAVAFAIAASTAYVEADELNAEEDGLAQLRHSLATRPDRAGFACFVGHKAQKNGRHEEALKAFQICADSGHTQSMIMLSHVYENGAGCDPNPELATYWVKQAALKGDSLGQYHYGVALLRGYGVSQDIELARFWLEKAAGGGVDEAAEVLHQANM